MGAMQQQRVALPGGDFSYLAAGDAGRPLALCLHGFPDVPRTFQHLLPALAAAGFYAVAPWLRGYAPSILSGPYDLDRIAADALEFIDALSPDRPAMLIGHDWGSAATLMACARRPARISRAVAMAVPHPMTFLGKLPLNLAQLRRSWYMMYFQLPVLPERRIPRENFALIDGLWRDWSPSFAAPPAHLAEVKQCLGQSLPAPINYYRAIAFPVGGAIRRIIDANRAERRIATPTLYLHGANDGCIGAEISEGQEKYFTGPLRREIVAGAGHFMQLEKPDAVNRLVLDWLKG
jgi:pimeloyl-ACP methyl ester carboxylesterase